MTLSAGDLTTPQRAAVWLPSPPALPSAILSQLITSMTALIYNKLNRSRLFSQNFVRTFNGQGTNQIILPDWPVTSITTLQLGAALINPYPLPNPTTGVVTNNFGYGYRYVPWSGNLPGDPSVIELVGGWFFRGNQNVQVAYTAGYLVQNEQWTVPSAGSSPNTVTVLQQQGPWCRDNGVTNVATGATMTPVASSPAPGQYIPPPDATPGLYTFNSTDVSNGLTVNISYSFIPADLEEACIQMVAERYSYRGRIGEISKSLGGQETARFLRGGMGRSVLELPPEVESLIQPYVSVIPPATGADV